MNDNKIDVMHVARQNADYLLNFINKQKAHAAKLLRHTGDTEGFDELMEYTELVQTAIEDGLIAIEDKIDN